MSTSITIDTITTTIEAATSSGPSFLGIKVDTINGPSDPRVRQALDKSFHLLDILEFIKVVDFKLNMTKRWGKAPSSNMVRRTMFV